MEDAIALAEYFQETGDNVDAALEMYQSIRKDEADRLQRTAVVSLSWFEHIDRYANAQSAEQFTFNMMCRAKRITYENLRLRDPQWRRPGRASTTSIQRILPCRSSSHSR
jgi:anthraniloyl-CoA monooxygenase